MDKPRTSQKLADNRFRMIDVGEKAVTRRRAVATGLICMKHETLERVRAKQVPKGDVLALAEAAGIMAAKKTPELLPLCHPLIIDSVVISTEFVNVNATEGAVRVSCKVICHGKTGVEMEALVGVNAALLCIYDLVKAIDPVLNLEQIHLETKEGGKSGHWKHPKSVNQNGCHQSSLVSESQNSLAGMRVCLMTVSDRCTSGESVDQTGPMLKSYFETRGAVLVEQLIVPDEVKKIRSHVEYWAKEKKVDVIVTSGGTGLSPRDQTPEAIVPLFNRTLVGFGEALRLKGSYSKPMAWLSRAEAGVVDQSLVFLLPGSQKAVSEALELLDGILEHALHVQKGGGH